MTAPSSRAPFRSLLVLLASTACGRPGASPDGGAARPAPPVVRADSAGLTFFWFGDDGSVERASGLSDVPLDARERVLVQQVGPDSPGSGAWAFVADLRKPGPDGTFPVEVMTREAYSREVRSRFAATTAVQLADRPPGSPDGGAGAAATPLPPAGDKVVIYLTQGCPHCRRAKEWMTRKGVPFVERDIEVDREGARFVQERTGSAAVPVFQVGTKVIQGFNPDALARAIKDQLGIELL